MITLFFAVMFGLFMFPGIFDATHVQWYLFLPHVGVYALFLRTAIYRKTVQMDDHSLYISVFRRVVVIPFEQIADVTASRRKYARGEMWDVTIHFKSDTPFGRSIVFAPHDAPTQGGAHPIVGELLACAGKKS
jgi:hypothetical protein